MRLLHQVATAAAQVAAASRLLDLLERSGGEDPRILRVLTYHRILEPGDETVYPGVVSTTPEGFARQVQLLTCRYRVISLADAVAALKGRAPLPPRALLLTFDDAYRDFAQHAWPLLRSQGLPVVLFVPTGFPDRPERPFWWDRLFRAFAFARRVAALLRCAGAIPAVRHEVRDRRFVTASE